MRHIPLAAAISGVLVLTGCGSSDSPKMPQATVTVTETAAPASYGDKFTELVVGMSWDQQTREDKTALCDGIDLFGPQWAADTLRDNMTSSNGYEVDYDIAAQIIQDKCVEEGYTPRT